VWLRKHQRGGVRGRGRRHPHGALRQFEIDEQTQKDVLAIAYSTEGDITRVQAVSEATLSA
jgi:hypothetical protein